MVPTAIRFRPRAVSPSPDVDGRTRRPLHRTRRCHRHRRLRCGGSGSQHRRTRAGPRNTGRSGDAARRMAATRRHRRAHALDFACLDMVAKQHAVPLIDFLSTDPQTRAPRSNRMTLTNCRPLKPGRSSRRVTPKRMPNASAPGQERIDDSASTPMGPGPSIRPFVSGTPRPVTVWSGSNNRSRPTISTATDVSISRRAHRPGREHPRVDRRRRTAR